MSADTPIVSAFIPSGGEDIRATCKLIGRPGQKLVEVLVLAETSDGLRSTGRFTTVERDLVDPANEAAHALMRARLGLA